MSESPLPAPAAFDPIVFRDVVGRLASGVAVITTRHNDVDFGMTASAVTSLSLEPPMMLVCVNRAAATREAVSGSGVFGINILHEGQADLALHFATPSADKFADVEHGRGELGCPRLSGTLAWLECEVADDVAGGTHSVFFGHVRYAEARDGRPLAYFRGKFGGLNSRSTDPIAVSLREVVLSMAADETLDIGELATGLSTTPAEVRRALSTMITDGLVAHDRRRGYRTVALDALAIERMFDARAAMELGALDLAFARRDSPLTPETLSQLRREAEATRTWCRDEQLTDVRAYAMANATFHESLVRLGGSLDLLDAYRRLALPGILVRALGPRSTVPVVLADDHVAIVDALEQGDHSAAAAAILRHTHQTKRTHLEVL